ncbi:MAG: 16S rRNA (cytosine(1402)-N(4))-methyltransferase RsmH [Actinomycetia bacterium]|nr:16S rRNA (cytosine(1402)-N(4))-methyltransferase RsmH [Actinomycetes bacterium]MCP4962618.1 16S rRNA (cytosine(1402)-N(4))-methyltransferase RsmH [Actinomycetes bacterium]
MAADIIELLAAAPAASSDDVPVFVDATLGGGGHAEALLDTVEHCRLIGLDRDETALAAATSRLSRFGDRFESHHVRFDRIDEVVEPGTTAGVLFDLGVSSHHLDVAARGFSFRNDGPLDMRMDRSDSLSAHDVVNTYDQKHLAAILRRNADERFAGRIAGAIVAARPIDGTIRLAEVVTGAIPAPALRNNRQPAARTFQALRIEVNSELDLLEPGLRVAIDSLATGGRIAVLSYHSGEDRIVKGVLRDESRVGPATRPDLPPPTGVEPRLRLLFSGGRTAGEAEVAVNSRAASARLRAGERTGVTT